MLDLTPGEVARDLITKQSDKDGLRAQVRAAEVKAWELRKAHGADSPQGQLLMRAAHLIPELYHRANNPKWFLDIDNGRFGSQVPILGSAT